MPLIVETGSLVPSANSYITVEEYETWAASRFGDRDTAPDTDLDREQIILRAHDYFETLDFIGKKRDQDQAMQWPRSWVMIDGYPVEADEIPKEVKNAIFEIAYAEELGQGPSNLISRKTTSVSVGPVRTTYSDTSARSITPAINNALKKLISGGGMMVFRA